MTFFSLALVKSIYFTIPFFNKMDFKIKIFKTLVGRLSIIFLIFYTISYIIGELVFTLKIGGNTIYYSIFFIVLVLICSVIIFFLLIKLEAKFFLYILFTLPVIVFCVLRFFDIFASPMDYIAEIILIPASFLLAIAFIVTTLFISEEKIIAASDKKREKIVKSVLESQEKYKEALERKKEDWEKVIEEE